MNIQDTKAAEKQLYYRLISLWVICEAFAGGIMHGLKIPFITPVPDGKDGSRLIEPILFKNSLFKSVCKLKSF